LAKVGWNSLYWDNHDQPRALSRWGDDAAYRVESAKTLLTTLHLHRGTPYVYQGDEIGMTNAPFTSIEDIADIESLRRYAEMAAAGADLDVVMDAVRARGRDNARTPMQWDGGPGAGFSTGTPWLAVNPNHVEVNAADAVADPGSVWHHVRQLIALRHTDPVVAEGDYTQLVPEHDQAFVFTRRLGQGELLVVANWSSRELDLRSPAGPAGLKEWATAPVVLATHPIGPTSSWLLAPWESRVYRR
ncbi:MAG TPA: alpha-amylase family glycosyl hydrolase, partial [Candidatus Lustribacter sp.]|nr:alpha-amylase family glycosyl hydrolase [Candidatus Lustribacter sp.]